MSERTGGCMCGAVRFTARDVPDTFGACHCEMCRRWTGSMTLSVGVLARNVTWSGEAQIATLQSSEWAERAWCRRCGSSLYYHGTEGGPDEDRYVISLGAFDDPNGFTFSHELFVDQKPDGVVFAGDRETLTRAEVMAKYGVEL